MIARRATQRTVAAAALALALPVLTGCGLESTDETQKEHTQVQAADNQIGEVKIRDAFLTTLPATSAAVGTGTTYLVVTLVNDGKDPDTFTGITTALGTATLSGGPVTLLPGVVVEISDPQIDSTDPTLVIAGSAPTVGTTQPVAFSFTTAGTTSDLPVPVVNPGEGLAPDQVIPTTQATVGTPIV